MADNLNSSLNQLYSPGATTIENGIQGGNFWASNTSLNPGVPVGNVLEYSVTLLPQNTIFTVSVPANSSIYVDLTTITNFSSAVVVPQTYVEFPYGVIFYVQSQPDNLSWVFSGYDLYDEKVVWAQNNIPNNNTLRGIKKLTSILVTNTNNSTVTATIANSSAFESPYYNFGEGSFFLNIKNGQNPFLELASTTAPAVVTWNFSIEEPSKNPLIPNLTASLGSVRPIIFANQEITETSVFTVQQLVYGYGSLPYWIDPTIVNDLINSKISVVGGTQYSDGWTAWQG